MKKELKFAEGYTIIVFDPDETIKVRGVHTIPNGGHILSFLTSSSDSIEMGMQLFKYYQQKEKDSIKFLKENEHCFLYVSNKSFSRFSNDSRQKIVDGLIEGVGTDTIISLKPTFLKCPTSAEIIDDYILDNSTVDHLTTVDEKGSLVKMRTIKKYVIILEEDSEYQKMVEVLPVKRSILKDFAYELGV